MTKLERRREKLRARIKRRSEVHPVTGCWLWTGPVHANGYGRITMRVPGYKNPKSIAVHIASYEAFKRARPKGLVVAHSIKCVSPLCCNPEHLRATTHSNNMLDVAKAKRWRQRNITALFPPTSVELGIGEDGGQEADAPERIEEAA